tara:strand:- start:597 stop:767 length:171 start_codon:yes stop_codon:yes gene_type:complete
MEMKMNDQFYWMTAEIAAEIVRECDADNWKRVSDIADARNVSFVSMVNKAREICNA